MGKGRGKGGRDSGPSPSPSPPIAEAEFRKHAGGGPGKDAWLVVDGHVYDVSSFQHRHPGGAELFRSRIGLRGIFAVCPPQDALDDFVRRSPA